MLMHLMLYRSSQLLLLAFCRGIKKGLINAALGLLFEGINLTESKCLISNSTSVTKELLSCYLISVPKAVGLLLAHKMRDTRFQWLLVRLAYTLVAVLSAGICVFNLLPTFLALGLFTYGVCLVVLLFWFGTGDIFLGFALEDEWFFELAIGYQALKIFEDRES